MMCSQSDDLGILGLKFHYQGALQLGNGKGRIDRDTVENVEVLFKGNI